MEVLGHKTCSIFDRCNITSEDDRREAAQRVAFSTGEALGKRAVGGRVGQARLAPKCVNLLPGEGFEPSLAVAHQGDFKSPVSTVPPPRRCRSFSTLHRRHQTGGLNQKAPRCSEPLLEKDHRATPWSLSEAEHEQRRSPRRSPASPAGETGPARQSSTSLRRPPPSVGRSPDPSRSPHGHRTLDHPRFPRRF